MVSWNSMFYLFEGPKDTHLQGRKTGKLSPEYDFHPLVIAILDYTESTRVS